MVKKTFTLLRIAVIKRAYKLYLEHVRNTTDYNWGLCEALWSAIEKETGISRSYETFSKSVFDIFPEFRKHRPPDAFVFWWNPSNTEARIKTFEAVIPEVAQSPNESFEATFEVPFDLRKLGLAMEEMLNYHGLWLNSIEKAEHDSGVIWLDSNGKSYCITMQETQTPLEDKPTTNGN